MKGEAVQQIPPLASLGQDDMMPASYVHHDKEKRNGKGSECVFVSMSVFPFLFRRKDEPKSSNATLFLQQEDQEGEASAAIARHSEPVISPAAKARADTRVGTKVQQILPLATLGQDDNQRGRWFG